VENKDISVAGDKDVAGSRDQTWAGRKKKKIQKAEKINREKASPAYRG